MHFTTTFYCSYCLHFAQIQPKETSLLCLCVWYLEVSDPCFWISVVFQELKSFGQQVTEEIWSILRALNKMVWDKKIEDKKFPSMSWSKSHTGVKTSWGGQDKKVCQILWRHTGHLGCASPTNIKGSMAKCMNRTAKIYNLHTRDHPLFVYFRVINQSSIFCYQNVYKQVCYCNSTLWQIFFSRIWLWK